VTLVTTLSAPVLGNSRSAHRRLGVPVGPSREQHDSARPVTNALLCDGCVASKAWSDGHLGGFRLSGFELLPDSGQEAINCVAVGVRGALGSSGFTWPEDGSGLWRFDSDVTHNSQNGIFSGLNEICPT